LTPAPEFAVVAANHPAPVAVQSPLTGKSPDATVTSSPDASVGQSEEKDQRPPSSSPSSAAAKSPSVRPYSSPDAAVGQSPASRTQPEVDKKVNPVKAAFDRIDEVMKDSSAAAKSPSVPTSDAGVGQSPAQDSVPTQPEVDPVKDAPNSAMKETVSSSPSSIRSEGKGSTNSEVVGQATGGEGKVALRDSNSNLKSGRGRRYSIITSLFISFFVVVVFSYYYETLLTAYLT